ncbi:MAG: hypothetical protein MMC33_008651 [Icmadophila ericetorum]|nr:hypothetical protein [Icmadophila ericetorum]
MSQQQQQQQRPLTAPSDPSAPRLGSTLTPSASNPLPPPPSTTTTTTTPSEPIKDSTFTPPTPQWLTGTWHVTHSTLPMWKTKRNVKITYKPLEPSKSGAHRLDDTVTYQTLTSPTLKTVRGIDTSAPPRGGPPDENTGAWNWRGKGWLAIASSHWAVLAWADGKEGDGVGVRGEEWAVTYFMKTLFTPAGIDIYSRMRDGLSVGTMEKIRFALKEVPDETVRRLAGELFEVKRDDGK